MIPCEFRQEMKEEPSVIHLMNEKWCDAFAKVGTLKMYVQRYKQVDEIAHCEMCVKGREAYKESFHDELEKLVEKIIESKELVEHVSSKVSGEMFECANVLKEFWEYVQGINRQTFNEESLERILDAIDVVVGVMMMLHKYVLNQE